MKAAASSPSKFLGILLGLFGASLVGACGTIPNKETKAAPPELDIVIKNGLLIDGSGKRGRISDIGIVGDRIAIIGALDTANAGTTIDASGLVAAPGFIDMHSHASFSYLIDPRALSKVSQGITTEIEGEGTSVAPINTKMAMRQGPLRDLLSANHATLAWETLDQFFTLLERSPGTVNFATYLGTSNVRQLTVGYEDRPATASEREAMVEVVEQAMRDGALGVYSALSYSPDQFNRTDELILMAKTAAQHGGLYQTHPRSEGDALGKSLGEIEAIAKQSEGAVHITHIKASFTQNWGRMNEIIAFVERMRSAGFNVTADLYPYERASGELTALLPPWAQEGGRDAIVERLKTNSIRDRIKRELEEPSELWENEYFGTKGGPEGITLIEFSGDGGFEQYEGRSLQQIADETGSDPRDTLMDLIQHGHAAFTSHITSSEDIALAVQQPWVAFGTDGASIAPDGPLSTGLPHPRAYGAFPKLYREFVSAGPLPIEKFVQRASAMPAKILGLEGRGIIAVGNFADIVIFDPNSYRDRATYDDPHQLSVGVHYVLVNGETVFRDGKATNARPGRVLRGPGYTGKR